MPISAYRFCCQIQHQAILALVAISVVGSLAFACRLDSPNPSGDLFLATTTSVYDSGLLDVLIPVFEVETGIHVLPIAVGTGAALRMAEEGNADVLFVHAPSAERALLESRDVVSRYLVAYNDFVIAGPSNDPAGLGSTTTAIQAFTAIANTQSPFISRGDDSGTHKRERSIWAEARITPGGSWYQASGQGMAATLTIADQKDAYVITDRATFLTLSERVNLVILMDGDPTLINLYSVLQVSPAKSGINALAAVAWIEFLLGEYAQSVIDDFGREIFGQSLFHAAAGFSDQEAADIFASTANSR